MKYTLFLYGNETAFAAMPPQAFVQVKAAFEGYTQALKDAVTYGHFGDLGITMFTLVILNRSNNPKLIYIFFILLTLHDYEHTISFSNFAKWVKESTKNYKWIIPALTTPKPVIA